MRHLSFSYEGASGDLHLKNVSFSFRRGERVAFIGESGSGKTTMLKLLRGLYDAHAYELWIDRHKVPGGFRAISPNIALIPQDPEIFNLSIRDNITFGLRHSHRKVRKYTDMARVTPVIERLPRKWDSLIVEKGVNLSGGEKQRLALARGLLASANKPIVLLDEPTSSVDAANELAIYRNILASQKNTTIISTLHRLHLLPFFDTIYVFSKGEIVAYGSYRELLRTSPEFRALLKKYKGKKE